MFYIFYLGFHPGHSFDVTLHIFFVDPASSDHSFCPIPNYVIYTMWSLLFPVLSTTKLVKPERIRTGYYDPKSSPFTNTFFNVTLKLEHSSFQKLSSFSSFSSCIAHMLLNQHSLQTNFNVPFNGFFYQKLDHLTLCHSTLDFSSTD